MIFQFLLLMRNIIYSKVILTGFKNQSGFLKLSELFPSSDLSAGNSEDQNKLSEL